MQQEKEEGVVQSSMLARAEEIQRQIQDISGRDLQLWSIGLLVMLVLTAGVLALVFPNLVWAQHMVRLDMAYLPPARVYCRGSGRTTGCAAPTTIFSVRAAPTERLTSCRSGASG